jgi:hypothetical protein
MDFFIKKYSVSKPLKLEILKVGRDDYNQIMSNLDNLSVKFSMKNADNGRYVILNDDATIEGDYIYYYFSKKHTKNIGSYIGEFNITFINETFGVEDSVINLPINEELNINVIDSISNDELCCKQDGNFEFINLTETARLTPTPTPTSTQTPTPTQTSTQTPTPTQTPTNTPTNTHTPTQTPTNTQTPTQTQTQTPTPSSSTVYVSNCKENLVVSYNCFPAPNVNNICVNTINVNYTLCDGTQKSFTLSNSNSIILFDCVDINSIVPSEPLGVGASIDIIDSPSTTDCGTIIPTPTATQTQTPTQSITPTNTPTPEVTPQVTPTPTQSEGAVIYNKGYLLVEPESESVFIANYLSNNGATFPDFRGFNSVDIPQTELSIKLYMDLFSDPLNTNLRVFELDIPQNTVFGSYRFETISIDSGTINEPAWYSFFIPDESMGGNILSSIRFGFNSENLIDAFTEPSLYNFGPINYNSDESTFINGNYRIYSTWVNSTLRLDNTNNNLFFRGGNL